MRKMIRSCLIGIIIVLILTMLLIGCSNGIQKIEELGPVEIYEYQGEKLSSIDDFYMNAIAGTQYIDRDQYRFQVTGLVELPREYTYDEVINGCQNYEKVVTLNCVEGWSVKIPWEEFILYDLVADANPLPKVTTII